MRMKEHPGADSWISPRASLRGNPMHVIGLLNLGLCLAIKSPPIQTQYAEAHFLVIGARLAEGEEPSHATLEVAPFYQAALLGRWSRGGAPDLPRLDPGACWPAGEHAMATALRFMMLQAIQAKISIPTAARVSSGACTPP